MRELGLDVVVEHRDPVRLQAFHVLVQRVHEDRERQVALEFGRRPRQDKMAALLCASGKLSDQPRLADPCLADNLDRPRTPLIELPQDLLKRAELLGAPDE